MSSPLFETVCATCGRRSGHARTCPHAQPVDKDLDECNLCGRLGGEHTESCFYRRA